MPKSTSVDVQARFLSALLQEHEVQPRALLLARQITEMLPGGAAAVYLLEEQGETRRWSAKAVAGDLRIEENVIPSIRAHWVFWPGKDNPCFCPERNLSAKTTPTFMPGAPSCLWPMSRWSSIRTSSGPWKLPASLRSSTRRISPRWWNWSSMPPPRFRAQLSTKANATRISNPSPA